MVNCLKLEAHDEVILLAALAIVGKTNETYTPDLGSKGLEDYQKDNAVYYILSQRHDRMVGKPDYLAITPSQAYDALTQVAKENAVPETIQHMGRTYRIAEQPVRCARKSFTIDSSS